MDQATPPATVQRLKSLLKQLAAKHKRLKAKFTETQEVLHTVTASRDEAVRRAEQLAAAATAAALAAPAEVPGGDGAPAGSAEETPAALAASAAQREAELREELEALRASLVNLRAEQDDRQGMAQAREHAAMKEAASLRGDQSTPATERGVRGGDYSCSCSAGSERASSGRVAHTTA